MYRRANSARSGSIGRRRYFKVRLSSRDPNYEDWFYAASQLNEHLSEEYENPAIEPFVEKMGSCTGEPRDQLKEAMSLACDYIAGVVARELDFPATRLDHLECLVNAAKDPAIEGCDIFTLNHDSLIEKVLENEEISFVDGFAVPYKNKAWWNPELLNGAARSYFLKLHGSINWFNYEERLAKISSDPTQTGPVYPSRERVLLGTFNKIRDYIKSPTWSFSQHSGGRLLESSIYM